VKELLSRKGADDNARFADVNQAVETIAREHQTLAEQVSTHQTDFSNKLSDMQRLLMRQPAHSPPCVSSFPLRTAAANAALMRPAITAQNKPPIADGAKAQ
jgi:hypothetical protein